MEPAKSAQFLNFVVISSPPEDAHLPDSLQFVKRIGKIRFFYVKQQQGQDLSPPAL
jgi:hypothetical protein